MNIELRTEETGGRFVATENNIDKGYLSFVRDGQDVIVVEHTVVPKEFGGQGIATKLVKEAIAYATAERLTVIAQCPFVHAYFESHPGEVSAIWQN